MQTLYGTAFDTPLGEMRCVQTPAGLAVLCFELDWERRYGTLQKRWPGFTMRGGDPLRVQEAVAAWFEGDRRPLEKVPVDLEGTEFQQQVWERVVEIPAGETRTYGDIAAALDNPSAARAVGAANGANPVALRVPCHRVVGAKGELTGYAGGLDRKDKLLALEARQRSLF